jgi:RimJ/RimL family protein N-acetyltransferase
MLDYIFGHDEVVANFVAQLIPECRERGFGKCAAIGVINEEGKLVGGLVYRNWCPEVGTIEISGAAIPGTNWLSRRTVQIMYDYPFYQVGCQMVIKTTMADNAIVLRIMAAVGFSLHYIKRLGGRDRDGVVGTLTVEDWEQSRYNSNRRRPAEQRDLFEEAA